MKVLLDVAVSAAKLHKRDKRVHCLGAVAVRQDGKFVCSNNGASTKPAPSAHAERRVLAKAGYGATLIVARVKRDGSLGLAYPCETCLAYIRSKGVERVYFSTPSGFESYIPKDWTDAELRDDRALFVRKVY